LTRRRVTGEVPMRKKLDMRHHKILLSIVLFVFLIISMIFGGYLHAASTGVPILEISTFALVLLLFGFLLLTVSLVIRTRDELHVMHEENRQHFHNVHERV
jgi:membrane protein YdbS with pleckstrin-like domain